MAFLRRGLLNSRTPVHNVHTRRAALEVEQQAEREEMIRMQNAIDAAVPKNDHPRVVLMSHILAEHTMHPQPNPEERYQNLANRRDHHKSLARESSELVKKNLMDGVPQGRIVDVKEIISLASETKYSNLVLLKCGHTIYSKSTYQGFCPHCK